MGSEMCIRDRQYLYLTFPINVYDKVTGSILSKPSRFLDDVSADLVDVWSVIDEGEPYRWG